MSAIQLLFNLGADIECRGGADGRTPLFFAAQQADTAATRVLVALGANVHARDVSNRTPLFAAARAGRCESVLVLLKAAAAGASSTGFGSISTSPTPSDLLSARDETGATAIFLAARYGHTHTIRTLAAAMGPAALLTDNLFDKKGRTPLFFAVENGHLAAAEAIRSLGITDMKVKQPKNTIRSAGNADREKETPVVDPPAIDISVAGEIANRQNGGDEAIACFLSASAQSLGASGASRSIASKASASYTRGGLSSDDDSS